ncbi:MAG TPA: hypothetical protein VJI15_05495 [Candidatus Nanoarchaeia archaeon]|nr:hypothetical protein [Candidatus Nanoarchaeia archaeon]
MRAGRLERVLQAVGIKEYTDFVRLEDALTAEIFASGGDENSTPSFDLFEYRELGVYDFLDDQYYLTSDKKMKWVPKDGANAIDLTDGAYLSQEQLGKILKLKTREVKIFVRQHQLEWVRHRRNDFYHVDNEVFTYQKRFQNIDHFLGIRI